MLFKENNEMIITLKNPNDLSNYVKMWLSICDYGVLFQNKRSLISIKNADFRTPYIKSYGDLAFQIANIDNIIYERIKQQAPNLMAQWEADNKEIYGLLFDPSNSNFKKIVGIQRIASLYFKKEYGNKEIDDLIARKANLFDLFPSLNGGDTISTFFLKDILDGKKGIATELEDIRATFVRIFIERKKLFFLQINIRMVELANKLAPVAIAKENFIDFLAFTDNLESYTDYRSLSVKDEIALIPNSFFTPNTLPSDNDKNDYDKKTKELSSKSSEFDSLLTQEDFTNLIKKVIDTKNEVDKKLSETTNTGFKYHLMDSLAKDTVWNKGKRSEALANHTTELGKTTFAYFGSQIGDYIVSGRPIDSESFWQGLVTTIGPAVFGAIGDFVGGPLLGALLSGIGSSIFGALFDHKPDPMEQLSGKIDEFQDNMNHRFDEVVHLLTDGFNQVFKGFNIIDDELKLIESQLRDLQKSVNDVIIRLDNTTFKGDIDKLSKSIQIVSNVYNSIFIKNEVISESFLTSLKNNDENNILNQIESTIKEYFSSNYQIVTDSCVPENNGNLNGVVFKSVIPTLQQNNVSFQDSIDSIEKDLSAISSCLKYYFTNRGSIKAVWSGCLLFEPEKLNYGNSLSSVSSTLIELYNMSYRNDRVNASLLYDANRIRNVVIGQNNYKLYKFYYDFKALAFSEQPNRHEGNFLSGFTFADVIVSADDIFKNQTSKYYALSPDNGITESNKPYQFRFVDNPVDEAMKQEANKMALSTFFYQNTENGNQPSNVWVDVQILLGGNNSLILQTLNAPASKEVKVFYFDDIVYDDSNRKRLIFDNIGNTAYDLTEKTGLVAVRVLAEIPFCSVKDMIMEKNIRSFDYIEFPKIETELKNKMIIYYPTKGLRWVCNANDARNPVLSLVICSWEYGSKNYADSRNFETILTINLNDYFNKNTAEYDLTPLRDADLYITVGKNNFGQEDKSVLNFSVQNKNTGEILKKANVSNNLFYPVYYQKQITDIGVLRAGEFLFDGLFQVILEKDGRLLAYKLKDSIPNTKVLVKELFKPQNALKNPTLKFQSKDSTMRLVLSNDSIIVAASTFYQFDKEDFMPGRLFLQNSNTGITYLKTGVYGHEFTSDTLIIQ